MVLGERSESILIGEPCWRVFEEDSLAALHLAAADQADRTRAPVNVNMNFNVGHYQPVPMCA